MSTKNFYIPLLELFDSSILIDKDLGINPLNFESTRDNGMGKTIITTWLRKTDENWLSLLLNKLYKLTAISEILKNLKIKSNKDSDPSYRILNKKLENISSLISVMINIYTDLKNENNDTPIETWTVQDEIIPAYFEDNGIVIDNDEDIDISSFPTLLKIAEVKDEKILDLMNNIFKVPQPSINLNNFELVPSQLNPYGFGGKRISKRKSKLSKRKSKLSKRKLSKRKLSKHKRKVYRKKTLKY